MQEIKAEIEKLQQSFANCKKQYEESKGYSDDCVEKSKDDEMYRLMCYVDNCTSNIYRYVSNLENSFYDYISEHRAGHLPKINGAGKLENALKVLGMSEDYNVEKPYVYASTKRGLVLEATYSKDK